MAVTSISASSEAPVSGDIFKVQHLIFYFITKIVLISNLKKALCTLTTACRHFNSFLINICEPVLAPCLHGEQSNPFLS